MQNLEEQIAEAPPDVARNLLAGLVSRVTLEFDHSGTFKGRRRPKTELKALEVELLDGVASLLGLSPKIRSLVADWKKYPIANRSFEELGTPIRPGRP